MRGALLVIYVTPYFTDNAKGFLRTLLPLPNVRVAAVAGEGAEKLPADLRAALVDVVHVEDPLLTDHIAAGIALISKNHGPVSRVLGITEQLQVQLGELRDRFDLPGMRAAQALGFRDKTLMKDLLRDANVPVARHRQVKTSADALQFAEEVGYPIIVKPPAGAAAQSTFRAADEAALRGALGPASIAAGGVVLLEEMVTGEEHSFDAFVKDGRVAFYSTSNYLPSCLEVVENPWMQWMVVLPRAYQVADIAELGERALQTLGLQNGMCHLEWFRRKDGSVVISEVGARPPGAQISTMIGLAHEVNVIDYWARLMVLDELAPFPERKFAVGAAYLRGQGEGTVRAVHGLDTIERDLGDLIVDKRIPQPGQPKGVSYEGEGFVLVRSPDTKVVEDALRHVVSTVRVELGGR